MGIVPECGQFKVDEEYTEGQREADNEVESSNLCQGVLKGIDKSTSSKAATMQAEQH